MIELSKFIKKYLFDPDCGYYSNKNPIGKDKDFITSPEISSIFGELIALYLVQITSDKSKISFVEMGAGTGSLFFDILATIYKLAEKKVGLAQDFIKKTDFNIIETSPALEELQKDKLKYFNITWHKYFQDFIQSRSQDSEILFISNELFDCFAIDQYVKTDIGWCQRLIAIEQQQINFKLANFNPDINQFIIDKIGFIESQKAPISAIFEFSKDADKFAHELFLAINKFGGIAINIDYGYIINEFANSLQSINNHKKVKFKDILQEKDGCDITAHVNFSMLDNIANNNQLNSSLVTQKEFLLSLGIVTREKQILKQNDSNALDVKRAINRLINAEEMGELFKVHIAWKE